MTQKDSQDDDTAGEAPRLADDASAPGAARRHPQDEASVGNGSPIDEAALGSIVPSRQDGDVAPVDQRLPWPEPEAGDDPGMIRPGLAFEPHLEVQPDLGPESRFDGTGPIEFASEASATSQEQAAADALPYVDQGVVQPGPETEQVSRQPDPAPTNDGPGGVYQASQAPTIVVRPPWTRPPPLAETPPWLWREVEPDIVRSSEGPSPPPVASEAAEPVVPPSEVKAAEAPPPAVADVAPVALYPDVTAYRAETPGRNDAPALEGPPTLEVVQPVFAPHVVRSQERQEPAWSDPPPVQSVFRDARPGDFARDGTFEAPTDGWARYKALGRTALRYAGYAVGGYFALVLVLILLYRFVNPPASSLMLVQAITGTSVQQDWVPLNEISPALVRAVIVSEDWSFCEHYGIDIKAIEQAIEKSGDGIPRGASTISMQTTKNLFLWNAKSYIRKAVELPLTLMIELVWPKRRILEIYLNVAEWGPGIFGAEAAAQYHFNKSAARLGEREAAQLAASLPNPMIRDAGDPGPRTARKASVIQSRMRNAGDAAQCVLGGRR